MWRASHRDSFYDERGRETSDLDEYANQATHQEALESCDTVSVRYPTFTVRLGESQQIDVGLITIGERRLIELIGIDAEAEVASRKNENRADDREEPSDDTRADQDRVDGRIGERQALTDGRPSEEGGERARAGENGRGSGTKACYDIPLFVERASGKVVYDFFEARRHMLTLRRDADVTLITQGELRNCR